MKLSIRIAYRAVYYPIPILIIFALLFSCSAGDRVICWKLDKKEYFFALVKPAGQNMSNGSRQAFLFRDGQLLPKIFSKKG